jgi:hypothetical protein
MIIDPDLREIDEPVVILRMSLSQARAVQCGLADIACWCRGFMAARGEDFHYDPMGLNEIRELNIALKRSIEEAK